MLPSAPMIARWWIGAMFLLCLPLVLAPDAGAQDMEDSSATTELACSFMMEKGAPVQQCHVPFPSGCQVAHRPGTTQPWTTISKGGRVQCQFDEKETDWKTKITGACSRCQSVRCSAHFSVRFDCSAQQ